MNTSAPSLGRVYQKLHEAYGAQRWWPADNAFEVMVGAVLTQNTAWKNVEQAIGNLKLARATTPERIVKLHHRRLASYLRPSGYYNVKARRLRALCKWLMDCGGQRVVRDWSTPELRHALLDVHGIGPETADDILLYAFQRPVFVIDAYTRRIFKRLGCISGDEGYEHLRKLFESTLDKDVQLFNEYHALIVRHAKQACRVKPICERCCLAAICRKQP
jgi:endonuclease-3 related protein